MSTAAKTKTYVLLPHMHPTAPISIGVARDKKIRLDKRPAYSPYLVYNVTDKEGNNKVVRLKLQANSIFQDEQIVKGILANAKFTNAERAAVKFVNGVLQTNKTIVQQFLESIPEFEGFDGERDGVRPTFKILDKEQENKIEIDEFKARLKAGNRIANMKLEAAQELLIKLKGAMYVPPASLEECQLELIQHGEDYGFEKINEDSVSVDEKTSVLVGKLLQLGILSFDQVPDNVSRKKENGWQALKEIPKQYDGEDKAKFFVEYLTSSEGKAMRGELYRELAAAEKAAESAA